VLSMFSGFGFDWPPAVCAIFNAFSLLNFNFELLAPECSVSLDYESRWCVGGQGRWWAVGRERSVCLCRAGCPVAGWLEPERQSMPVLRLTASIANPEASSCMWVILVLCAGTSYSPCL
jgi:hypothetical protein